MTADARFLVTCRRCGQLVLVVARIGDAELDRLREHIRQMHPREALTADAGAHETLRHHLVEQNS